MEFILPKGEVQVPMLVTVNVPKSAELGNYKGSINIKMTSATTGQSSGVAIALGARVDINLTVTNMTFTDFIVRSAAIPDFEILKWPWSLPIFSTFLHRISVVMNIENIGNAKVSPSKVSLEVFDIAKTKTLETAVDTSIKKIDSFATAEAVAHFRTKLGPGQYWGKVKIYKDENIVNVYEIAFTIARPGELAKGTPSLGAYPWILLAIYMISLILILALMIRIKIWRLAAKFAVLAVSLLAKPFMPVKKKASTGLTSAKAGFWRWVSKKASKYNQDQHKDR
ncbi:hypothetical protein HGA64_01385 [Candidatus Falkowbacteria bacterium]|nr:hypothetical protein [Candidatus Falkowbacteria bacterium]